MKRILKVISTAFIICLIPFSIVAGQEKKTEHKIKIIIDDGSGKNVVIDTLLNDDTINNPIKLKDGKVIFIGDGADMKHHDGNKQVSVTVSDDGKDTKKVVKEITIVSSDEPTGKEDNEGDKIYVYNDSKADEGKTGEHHKVITLSDKGGNGPEEKVIIIKDGKVIENKSGETFEYTIKSGIEESDAEMTKYIISKDGMVITIEGNDYNKVKELVKEIESKLDVRKEGGKKK
jgi:hypothetical protein